MNFNENVIESLVDLIHKASDETLDDLRGKWIEQEPVFTDILLENIKCKIDGAKTNGIRWKAKILTDRGSNSQEYIYGADFMGVLNIDVEGFLVKKGFLAQAKLDSGKKMNKNEWQFLADQCSKMLALSSDSFVVVYSPKGIRVFPAISVCSKKGIGLEGLSFMHIEDFFRLHLKCFIGDKNLNSPLLFNKKQLNISARDDSPPPVHGLNVLTSKKNRCNSLNTDLSSDDENESGNGFGSIGRQEPPLLC